MQPVLQELIDVEAGRAIGVARSTRSPVGAPRKATIVLADQRMNNGRALDPIDDPALRRHATLA
jgi:hypothetical protein